MLYSAGGSSTAPAIMAYSMSHATMLFRLSAMAQQGGDRRRHTTPLSAAPPPSFHVSGGRPCVSPSGFTYPPPARAQPEQRAFGPVSEDQYRRQFMAMQGNARTTPPSGHPSSGPTSALVDVPAHPVVVVTSTRTSRKLSFQGAAKKLRKVNKHLLKRSGQTASSGTELLASHPFRRLAAARQAYTKGSPVGLDDFEDDEAIIRETADAALAKSTQERYSSCMKWWAKRCLPRGMNPLPITVKKLRLAAGLLKKGRYRSGYLYLAAM